MYDPVLSSPEANGGGGAVQVLTSEQDFKGVLEEPLSRSDEHRWGRNLGTIPVRVRK